MIFIFHENEKIIDAYDFINKREISINTSFSIQQNLYNLSLEFEDFFLGWCHKDLKEFINLKCLTKILHHKKLMYSFAINKEFILNENLGFVDSTASINVHFEHNYPTWLMSSNIGCTHSKILNKFENFLSNTLSFDEYLCYVAKSSMSKGIICKSVPQLLLNNNLDTVKIDKPKNTNSILVYFIKNNYKKRWLFLLSLNLILYKKKNILLLVILSFLKKKINNKSVNFSDIPLLSNKDKILEENFSVDVIIPTLGRAKYLFDVLKCLSKQTILPKKVIIVEQNPNKKSISELSFIMEKNDWPFKIDHTFIHQMGACNARNICLKKVESSWAFFADDDILFGKDVLRNGFEQLNLLGEDCLTFSCLKRNEDEFFRHNFQWQEFGTNASLVNSSFLKHVKFKKEHEFGYGEDSDFGMQLRYLGCDNIYVPSIKLLHLHAPIGGFRYKHTYGWSNDTIQPKPSPTVMAYFLKHKTKPQQLGYKTTLYFKYFKNQKTKNPYLYIKDMNLKWKKSIYLANKTMEI